MSMRGRDAWSQSTPLMSILVFMIKRPLKQTGDVILKKLIIIFSPILLPQVGHTFVVPLFQIVERNSIELNPKSSRTYHLSTRAHPSGLTPPPINYYLPANWIIQCKPGSINRTLAINTQPTVDPLPLFPIFNSPQPHSFRNKRVNKTKNSRIVDKNWNYWPGQKEGNYSGPRTAIVWPPYHRRAVRRL